MATYKVYPGYGKLTPSDAVESYIDAPALASLFGLGAFDYEVGSGPDVVTHINLRPRPDGLYRNIKTELGDNGTPYHIDKMVNPEKWKRDNYDYDINGYRS